MTTKEKKLTAYLLRMSADLFANRGCNDLNEEIWEGWTDEERRNLIAEYHLENGDPEEAEERHKDIDDWALMCHMANKIESDE